MHFSGAHPGPHPGAQLRRVREEQGISLRELSRRLDVSPGHLSQVERSLAAPSISLLYGMAAELGVSLDALFDHPPDIVPPVPATPTDQPPTREAQYVRRSGERQAIEAGAGVRWELLTPTTQTSIDFREIIYTPSPDPPGPGQLIRHSGHEYGVVLQGQLHIQIEFDTFILSAGDSIGFDSSRPHRLWNQGSTAVRAVWVSNVQE